MHHPLDFIPNRVRKPIFWAALIWTLGLFAIFRFLNTPLTTSAAPGGIVTFELVKDIKPLVELLASWDQNANLYAAFGLGLDYLFMPSYAFTIALGILLAAGRHNGAWMKAGMWLGWGQFAAALFDAVENYALFKILLGAVTYTWPRIAYWCASLKFGLLVLGLLFALIGWLWPRKRTG